jgi:D-alanine-D-alanine ligase
MTYEPSTFGKVAVLMGGLSAEREISLLSGNAVLNALLRKKVDAFAIDVGHDICSQLLSHKIDRIFNVLHGPGGEDGTIQGLLELLEIPYTGSAVLSSALTMDKVRTKWIWNALGFPTPDFMLISHQTSVEEVSSRLDFPFIIKPVCQGSTLGITKVTNAKQFQEAKELAFTFDAQVMAEKWIDGQELTVGILGQEPLPIVRIVAPLGNYDYEAKYFTNETQYFCPSHLDSDLEEHLKNLSYRAYDVLACRHWGRVDLMLDHNNQPWLLEVNTIPGMTDHSLVPKAAQALGINFDDLIIRILTMTLSGI